MNGHGPTFSDTYYGDENLYIASFQQMEDKMNFPDGQQMYNYVVYGLGLEDDNPVAHHQFRCAVHQIVTSICKTCFDKSCQCIICGKSGHHVDG